MEHKIRKENYSKLRKVVLEDKRAEALIKKYEVQRYGIIFLYFLVLAFAQDRLIRIYFLALESMKFDTENFGQLARSGEIGKQLLGCAAVIFLAAFVFMFIYKRSLSSPVDYMSDEDVEILNNASLDSFVKNNTDQFVVGEKSGCGFRSIVKVPRVEVEQVV